MIVFFVLNVAFCSLWAQTLDTPLLRESFDYAEYNPLWCAESPDSNWKGEWSRIKGDDVIIRQGNLDYNGWGTAWGNHVSIPFISAGIRYNRPTELIADDGQVLWASVMMEFKAGNHPNNVGNITLLKSGSQVFTFGRKYGNELFGFIWPPNVGAYNTNIPTDGLHWVVVKIQFSGDSGEEKAWMWIDPPANMEPDSSSANLIVPEAGKPALRINDGIDGVQIKAEGVAPLRLAMDELRLGRSFESVNPFLATGLSDELFPGTIKLIPNPVAENLEIHIQMTYPQHLTFELYTTDGRQLHTFLPQRYEAGIMKIQLSLSQLHIAPGLYLLRVKGEKGGVSKRFWYNGN